MFIGQTQFFISQVYLKSIWQIMSELHCFFHWFIVSWLFYFSFQNHFEFQLYWWPAQMEISPSGSLQYDLI